MKNSYFTPVFVSDELVGKIISVTGSRHLQTCQNSQLIMNAPCQMRSAAAWLLSALFMLSSGSLFGVF